MSFFLLLVSVLYYSGVPRRRRRVAGAERSSRVSQGYLDRPYARMRATEHAPRGPFHVLERRHSLAELVERGGGVLVERLPVNRRSAV